MHLVVPLLLFVASHALMAADLERFLEVSEPSKVFPGADRIGSPVGAPLVAPAFKGDQSIGYVFLNSDFVNATGYSGKPIHVRLAIDMDGVIQRAVLVEHHEPIVLIGIPERKITAVIDKYVGLNVADRVRQGGQDHKVDIVSGATVTIMVIDDSILRSAIKVARTYGLGGLEPKKEERARPKAAIDASQSAIEDWSTLLGDGSVRRLTLPVGELNRAFEESGDLVAAQRPEPGAPDDVYIDLYSALVSIPTVGRSLLGDAEYTNLQNRLKPGQQAILVAGFGRYSFKGSGYVRGGIFDRFQLIQGDNSIRFRDRHHKRLRQVAAAGAPGFKEVDLFRIPEDAPFEATEPWRLELLVSRATGATTKAYLTFDLGYRPPEKYLVVHAPAEEAEAAGPQQASVSASADGPLWHRLWRQKTVEIAVLVIALGVLTWIFFFQGWLVKRPRLTEWVRVGFLIFTLFGIGFYANAQLSVVNIMTVFSALVSGFSWEYFLMEPLIFILWGSVAASLLLWGRGPYCGWLCPFGALQELLSRIAKAMKIPQLRVPWWLHERAWAVKYIVFLALFGVSLHSLAWAERLAEVEPFKTAIVLKFMRDWPFVVFALALLVAGLFIERFYCRYFCALGAALAIPGKLRLFEWLKRYKQCGTPCQRCANECMVQAIHPEGNINPNECHYCLHCHVLYTDEHRCPVMIERRQKRERRAASSTKDPTPHMARLGVEVKEPG